MDRCEVLNYRREGLILRLTGLVLLAFTAISQQSYFHLLLFVISLCLNATFVFRRIFAPATGVINLAAACLALHLFLLLVAQITYIQVNLTITFKRILGLPYFFCSSDVYSACEEPSWNVYVGVATELCLASLLFWTKRISFFSTEYYTSEVQIESIGIKQMYLLTPISIIFWALLFPSWLNFIWILVSWFLFSLIGERHHRLLRAPFILTFASILLLLQYISGLTSFQGIMLEKLGLHSGVGSAAFYPLLIKVLLCIPFYMIRYFDGRHSKTFSTFESITTVRITDVSMTSVSTTTTSLESFLRIPGILYVCLYYVYILIHGDWLALSNSEWLSPAVQALEKIAFRLGSAVDILWRPTCVFARILATNYDILIVISLCCFASYYLSIAGIVLLVLSLIIFITTGQRCKNSVMACFITALLLSFQWLMSFITYSFYLPNNIYLQNCTFNHGMIIDHNMFKWFGFSLNQVIIQLLVHMNFDTELLSITWPIVILLLIISMRGAFSTERSKWLIEMQRSDAEEDAVSLLKFLSKNWMYKFGVEVCSVLGIVLACYRHDIFGLYFLVVISFLRVCRRWLQKLIWPSYTNLTLIILVLEYLSALGLPNQFSHCYNHVWNVWSTEVNRFFVLPFTTSSFPTFIADYIFLLLILKQKNVFNREKEHPENDNTPLSESDFSQPIPALYNDFISMKGISNGAISNFGYIVAVFLFMWKGVSLYTCHSFKSILAYWNCLDWNTIPSYSGNLKSFLFFKDVFCKFGFAFPCWLERVFGLYCVPNEYFGHNKKTYLICDVICFVVLIYQMRVFNSWYFQFVIMDYRADRILGSRGGELLLELRKREALKNHRRLQDNVKWLRMMVEEEDKYAPISIDSSPQSHEEIKRSGYYHQVSERFFPLRNADINFEQEQMYSLFSRKFNENVLENNDTTTMVEKTVERKEAVRSFKHVA
ncbi:unnamed protein product [Onchocerca flexuosa]|uniref:PIEZO domain-containing protein n=1 Tax=Onchocerca flexuosa TaxID=387005 RepID=A0A183H1L2_9BILA|nr:unnamed protein product [Onchocerca flexuosa]